MAAGGWGIAPLLQKSNFCEPKRPNNFCNLSRRNFDRLSNNDQLFRFRTLTSCYAMLCYIYPYFKHRLCLHNYASKTLALRPFRQTYTQLCDNNLVSIPSNLQFLKPYHNRKFITFILKPVINCFVFERWCHTIYFLT